MTVYRDPALTPVKKPGLVIWDLDGDDKRHALVRDGLIIFVGSEMREIRVMMLFSQPPQPDADFEAWRNYAAHVSDAIRERREDAYDDTGKMFWRSKMIPKG